MSDKTKDIQKKIDNIAQEIEESTLLMSDDEINEEIKAMGEDPEASANKVRSLIQSSIMKQKKKRFAEAEQRIEQQRKLFQNIDIGLNEGNQRDLLINILSQNPSIQERLTVQFRDLNELSDEDVASILRDIKKLNLLRDQDKDE